MAKPAADETAWRYERKFVVAGHDARAVEQIVRLHPALLRQPYPPRYVNNLYFDRVDRRAFWDSVDGVEERTKVRARWYGAAQGTVDANLEFKIKDGLVGRKEIYALPPFVIGERIERRAAVQWLLAGTLSATARERAAALEPVLINRYARRYFATPDGLVRLTVDADLEFRHLGAGGFVRRPVPERLPIVVVELKYAPEHEALARAVSDALPFRLGRNSKFVTGLERW